LKANVLELRAIMSERASNFHPLWTLLRAVLLVLVAACSTQPPAPGERPAQPPRAPAAKAPPQTLPEQPAKPPGTTAEVSFLPVSWTELPGWREDDVGEAWPALLASCGAIAKRELWREICSAAEALRAPDRERARAFFEAHLTPHLVTSSESGADGLITGYYEPMLRGSRTPDARYRYPLYGVPDDLVVVDLASVYPELKSMRLRGRLNGRRLVPYLERAQIESPSEPLRGQEIAWVDDAIDLFFLHIQGSGRILLESGEIMRVGYAEQNGHPYRAIGRVLLDRGEMAPGEVSMQSIKAWLRARPGQSSDILNANSSYVFFRELPANPQGPPGSLGVPLTAMRSIAVDQRHIPLGTPVFIATTWPGTSRPLNRLTMAQDTGGAIRGAIRADFFWGAGEAAEREAGLMKEPLRMWVLLPRDHTPSAPGRTD
jgi:membrane-bound lytic murein transglycosylase A